MSKHYKLAALWCLGLVLVVSAQGADEKKGLMIGGSFEGGYAFGWRATPSLKESQFFVDDLAMKFHVNVSDKTKVVLDEHFTLGPTPGTASALSSGFNSRTYHSSAALLSATSRGSNFFSLSSEAAYLDHKCGENLHTQVGLVRVPFGMENGWERYDMNTYYYSTGYGLASAYGWTSDLGLKWAYDGFGNLEVAVLDGRQNAVAQAAGNINNYSPSTAIRWGGDFKAGEMTLTPSVSNYAGRWHSSPGDLGVTAGLGMKMSSFWANLEYIYTSSKLLHTDATNNKTSNVWLEPGFDFGMMNLSAKAEYVSTSVGSAAATNDWNVGMGVSHEYTEKMRVKLAYTHRNLSGNNGLHGNDIRLLFGTKW